MASPTILDSLPLTVSGGNVLDGGSNTVGKYGSASSFSFTYNVPAGGTNKALVVIMAGPPANGNSFVVSTNSGAQSITMVDFYTSGAQQIWMSYGVLAAPQSGTFSFSWSNGPNQFVSTLFTLKDAAQTSIVDTIGHNNFISNNTDTLSITTTNANDILIDVAVWGGSHTLSYGTFSTLLTSTNTPPATPSLIMGYLGVSSSGSQSSQVNSNGSNTGDHVLLAIKGVAAAAGPANVKTWDGITQSTGVKTYDGVAIASTKSWDGIL